jgi:glycerophosphoryl diester phosphodiesterase
VEPLRRPPIAFAHRGARAHAPDNTLESFQLALRLGATGLESDVWLTADGVPVLDHDGVVRQGVRRRPIRDVTRARLPPSVPTLEQLYETCGAGFELSLDVLDAAATPAILRVAGEVPDAVGRLWLCHPDWHQVVEWRALSTDVRLVDSTRLRRIKEGPERRAADLADAGVDAINLHASDWTAGLTTLFHRFERLAFGWDAQQERVLAALLAMGVDAVYSDHVDRMVAAVDASQR